MTMEELQLEVQQSWYGHSLLQEEKQDKNTSSV